MSHNLLTRVSRLYTYVCTYVTCIIFMYLYSPFDMKMLVRRNEHHSPVSLIRTVFRYRCKACMYVYIHVHNPGIPYIRCKKCPLSTYICNTYK